MWINTSISPIRRIIDAIKRTVFELSGRRKTVVYLTEDIHRACDFLKNKGNPLPLLYKMICNSWRGGDVFAAKYVWVKEEE